MADGRKVGKSTENQVRRKKERENKVSKDRGKRVDTADSIFPLRTPNHE